MIYLFTYSTSICVAFLGDGDRALNKTKLLMNVTFCGFQGRTLKKTNQDGNFRQCYEVGTTFGWGALSNSDR